MNQADKEGLLQHLGEQLDELFLRARQRRTSGEPAAGRTYDAQDFSNQDNADQDSADQHNTEEKQGEAVTDEFRRSAQTLVQGMFSKLDLVSREEFDAQSKLLAAAEAHISQLEEELKALTEQLGQAEK